MTTDSRVEVYCPRCEWVPDGGAHWQCTCNCVWNTFETAAVCPQCQRCWRNTDCPTEPGGCGRMSPHLDWYHGLDELIAELVEEALPATVSTAA